MSAADRLRWRCRRGMLELDLILLRFLDEEYPRLSAADRQAFEAMLAWHDDTLVGLISGDAATVEPCFLGVVERLRQC